MTERLLTVTGPDLGRHLTRHGDLPLRGPARPGSLGPLAEEIAASGLRGRGGGWFPTARKLTAVAAAARSRPPVVVVNAMEGEPLSAKDARLLAVAPHLVLDGATLAAETVGADRIVLAVPVGGGGPVLRNAMTEHAHRSTDAVPTGDLGSVLRGVVAERARRGIDPVLIEVVEGPDRFLSGQESALVGWIGGGPAIPTTKRPYEQGVSGRATLVSNAETFAHLALIARHGATWFRSVGTADAPGTMLVSVSDPDIRVLEVPVGTLAGAVTGPTPAVLLGGYGGAWLPGDRARELPLAPEPLQAAGAALGAGIVSALPYGACGLRRTAAVAGWTAGQGARQCGPCLFGLPAVAGDLALLADGRATRADVDRLRARTGLLPGRGGCAHPDGVARLTGSALRVFADEVEAHLHGHCVETLTYRRAS
ncbi:NADH-ubiquinone oxidoreductase-F iron-sulfur binding region domain-containing protein [Actinoallomurus sp. NPDC050550]|uniref:NADH-ubiquinone oxidoreductase-F iron-sulfur binding region domain-containing protein n=1 Tax=Actinoallomurus sp. NPDC050550 TaxID=3154937 RepID=UPI0033ECFCB2